MKFYFRFFTRGCVVAAASLVTGFASAATFEVNEFLSPVAVPTPNAWYASDIRAAGTASIVDLTGLGGDLETNQPLPTGAALLTTNLDNADKAEVATFDDFGDASAVLGNLNLDYSYYKETVGGGNIFAAPSIKLALFSPVPGSDNFGQLVYEPNWNQPGGGSQAAPADAWQAVSIDSNTGSGADPSGGWWWTGGFEIPSSAGGPPLRSLNEWVADFNAADADFATARVVSIAVGVGTFNQGQIGYFDEVTFSVTGGESRTYDFQAAIPEPGTLAMVGFGALFALRGRN